MSAAFSPIMIDGALVLPDVSVGMIEASATRNYQIEYSRNLVFEVGGHMEQVFQALIDRSRAPLDLKTIKTILGYKHRPKNRRRTKRPADIVIKKQKPSGFFGTNLTSYLTLLGCDSVIVVGTTTAGCVRATVVDAFSLNYRVILAEEGCFDRSEASHAVSLCDMHAKYADVLPTAEILSYFEQLPTDLFDLPTGGRSGSMTRANRTSDGRIQTLTSWPHCHQIFTLLVINLLLRALIPGYPVLI
jgi:hypothetical protein